MYIHINIYYNMPTCLYWYNAYNKSQSVSKEPLVNYRAVDLVKPVNKQK